MDDRIREQMDHAIAQAWKALSGYKFLMLGYHAVRWVNYNKLFPLVDRLSNPFIDVVKLARSKKEKL
ncbi:hypothetical protein LCGC14_1410390 [marine sediment metagenome]|uniref:Uncharacterized protein n=1 Tax=marine sediment metagenome TaxID=412755 RepID=A0A0F9KFG5_9ZZZZ